MRGQVSLIVIIAVLLLFAVFGTIYMVKRSPVSSAAGFGDLQVAFSDCLQQQMQDLIPVAAAHGGELAYAVVPSGTERTVTTSSGSVVPLWNSYSAPGTSCFSPQGCLSYYRPKLDALDTAGSSVGGLSVAREFEMALNDTARTCLERSARRLNVTADVRSVSTSVVIGDPIHVTGEARGSFSRDGRSIAELKGSADVRSSFSELFSAAKNLTILDSETGFFASYIGDVVTLKSGLAASDPYPPVYAYDLSFATHVWTAQGVASQLSQDLKTYLPLVQFASSRTDYSSLPYVLRRGLLDFNESGRLLGDRVFLSAEPAGQPQVLLNGGQFEQGQGIVPVIPLIGDLIPVKTYQTSYDIEAPIVVTLTSRDDGLAFSFGLDPRIFHNQPLRSDAHALALSSSGDGGALAKASSAFCSQPTGAQVSLSLSGPDAPDPNNTSLTYRCGAATCTYPFSSQITLPTCIGGTLSAAAPNVRFDDVKLDSKPGMTNGASLIAHAKREVTVSGRLIETTPMWKIEKLQPVPASLDPGAVRSLSADEQMIVQFKGVDNGYTSAVVVNSTDPDPSVPIYDGTYSVSVTVMRRLSSPVIIPAQSNCIVFCLLGRENIPAVRFNGTLVLDQQKGLGPITIGRDSHVSLDVPIFDLAKIPQDQRLVEDLQFYDMLDQAMQAGHGGVQVTSP